jgi:hypothetical protein
MTPRKQAQKLENHITLPEGSEERFNGFGVMGLPFSSGHVLALRRFMASSVGNGYTSVWHRSPDKSWTFYADVDPRHACTRYFGRQAAQALVTPITIKWLDDFSFEVTIESANLYWYVSATATPATVIMNAIGAVLPQSAWKHALVLRIMGKMAGAALGLQKVGLTGVAPNGQHFKANPKTIWAVKQSHASLAGEDLGKPMPLQDQAHLVDFWIPQKGILAFGQAYFDVFDPGKHLAVIAGNFTETY